MIKPVLSYINILRWPSAIPAGPFTARFMSAVAGTGVETHLVVQSAAKGFNGCDGDGKAVLKNEYGIDSPELLNIHVIPMPHWKPASDRIFYLAKAGRLLKRLVRKHGVNVVMSRDTRALPYLTRWQRLDIKTAHDTHNFYMDIESRDDLSGKRWERYQDLERKHIPRLDGVLTLLDVQADLYRKSLNSNEPLVSSAHPGLDQARPSLPGRPEHKNVLYLGSLQRKKGVYMLLDAFKNVDANDWKLAYVGGRDRNEIDPLKHRVNELGLSSKVEISGWLDNNKMRKKIEQASIAVLPLEDKFYNHYLTAPSKLFDYLGHAIPVISSDTPAIRELADDAVVYVKPGDKVDLSEKMEELIKSPEKQAQLAVKAHQRAQFLTWDKRGEKTKTFLEVLLNR